MGKSKKVFGDVNLTWTKVIVFAIISGIYTTIMNSKRYFFFGYNSYFCRKDVNSGNGLYDFFKKQGSRKSCGNDYRQR